MYLSQIDRGDGTPMTPGCEEFRQLLRNIAYDMYTKGWTVIGSEGKRPCLHPWKNPSRDQLYAWTQEDLVTHKATALNLRLSDSQVIALDCDFYDGSLMEVFVSELSDLLGINRRHFYTIVGGKGGKLFFRYASQTVNDKPPCRLGPVAYSNGFAGNKVAKQELEVKSELSTIAGLHSHITRYDDMFEWGDAKIYTAYQGCKSIVGARPSDLQVLSRRDLEAIEDLYTSLLVRGHFVDESGGLIAMQDNSMMALSAVATYLLRIACRQKDGFNYGQFVHDVMHDSEFTALISPYFAYLRLDAANDAIRRLFFEGPPVRLDLEALLHTMMCDLKDGKTRKLWEYSGAFAKLTYRSLERLRQEAQAKGLISQSMQLDGLALFALLRSKECKEDFDVAC